MKLPTPILVWFYGLFAGRCHIKRHLSLKPEWSGLWMAYTRHAPRCNRRAVVGINVTNGVGGGHMALCREHAGNELDA